MAFPFSAAAGAATSGLNLGGGPGVAESGGPFESNANFEGIRQGIQFDQNTAIIVGTALIAGAIVFAITRK